MKKKMAEKMSLASKIKSCITACSSARTVKNSKDFKSVLEVVFKVLQKFIRETAPQAASARSEKKSKKCPSEKPHEGKSAATDVGSSRKNHKSKRKDEKEKRGDVLKIHTPYRPKDGYHHDPEISSYKGSMLSLPSDHSYRSYALSIFSVMSSARREPQNGAETVLPNARKSKRCQKTLDSE